MKKYTSGGMTMLLPKLGISTLAYRESALQTALDKIKKHGIRRIDLAIIPPTFCPHYNPMTSKRDDDLRLKELLDSMDFTVSALNVVPGFFNRGDPDAVHHFIRRSIDIAFLLGAHSVTIPSGARVDAADWERNVLEIRKHLLDVNRYANEKGVFLSVETPHVRTLTETMVESQRFHEILAEPTIKCTLDTSHVRRLGDVQPLDALIILGVDRVNHVHLRDAFGEDIDLTPGTGTCDFRSFITYLKENSYKGDFILELEYEDITEREKSREIRSAIRYCSALLGTGKHSLAMKFKTSWLAKLLVRTKRNPIAEIRRHKRLLAILKGAKNIMKPYLAETVYEGRWHKKLRWNKRKVVRHRENSIELMNKPNKVIDVGIVGCGWAGAKMHAPGFHRLRDVQIVGVYDIVREKTELCANEFNARPCNSIDELIFDCRPRLISICSREWAHHEAAMKALTNGVDVFCEKLLATRYQDGVDMVTAAKKHGRVLGVNYNYHYMPGIRKIKEVIAQQALDNLVLLNINVHAFSYAHALDLLSFLGGKILSVSAYYKNDNNLRQFGGTDWSTYDDDILYIPSIVTSVTAEFENGAIGIVNSSYYYDLYAFVLSLEAVFERGTLTLNGINMFNTLGSLTYAPPGRIQKVDMDHRRGVYAKGYEYTFYESIRDFVECYVAGKSAPTDGEQALFNMKLEKAIARSNARHEKICLDEVI